MRSCNSIYREYNTFDDIQMDKMERKDTDPKIKETFKRKPYESIAECYERLKKEEEENE